MEQKETTITFCEWFNNLSEEEQNEYYEDSEANYYIDSFKEYYY